VALGLVLIVVIVGLPLAYMAWRFKRGEESVAGGSMGEQLIRGNARESGSAAPNQVRSFCSGFRPRGVRSG
jgi:hypothetical protein